MGSVPLQTPGSSPIIATDWNTYVRDNFAAIRGGHIISASAPSSPVVGTMYFDTGTSLLRVFTADGWQTFANLVSNTLSNGTTQPLYCPVGMVSPFASNTLPAGWVFCNGASVARVGVYKALFDVISTSYGSVDANSFNLPDLQGRMVVGKGTQSDVNTLGKSDGETTVANRRPKHNHSLSASAVSGGQTAFPYAINQYAAGSGSAFTLNVQSQAGGYIGGTFATANDHTHSVTGTAGITNNAITNPSEAPSYQVLNYIIKY